jgi:spore germination protein GerM
MRTKCLVSIGVVLTLLAGCGIPVEDRARPLTGAQIPSSAPTEGGTPQPPPGETVGPSAELYFVRDSRLAPVRRPVPVPQSLENAISALLRGPTAAERNEGMRTAVTRQVRVAGTIAAGVPLIDVTDAFIGIEGEEQILALAQLVFTLTGISGVEGVSFALAGRAVEVPTGDGTLKRGPLRRHDYAAVAPAD